MPGCDLSFLLVDMKAPAHPSTETDLLLELNQVTVRSAIHPHIERIQNWDWSIAKGDRWLVGAPPGSGKTSLLSVAAGLNQPAQGSVRFFGKSVEELEPESWLEEKLRLGFVFEDGGKVFQDLSVYENLMLPLDYHERGDLPSRHAQVETVLEWTRMSSMLHDSAARLSRNWKQRLGLARALTMMPDVLFLDNPLGAVDTHHSMWWLDFIDRLMADTLGWRPMALIVSASDLTPWLARVNRLALINERNWVEIDPTDRSTLQENPLFQTLVTSKI